MRRLILSLAAALPIAASLLSGAPSALAATGGGSPAATAAPYGLTAANDPACTMPSSTIKHAVIGAPMRAKLVLVPLPNQGPGAYACNWYPKGHPDDVGYFFFQKGKQAWRTYRQMISFPGSHPLRGSAPGARYTINTYDNAFAWWPRGHRVSELSGLRGHLRAVARGLRCLYNERV